MYDRFISPVVSLPGSGTSAVMLRGTSAPAAAVTFWPKLVMPWILKNPPGQRPSFCVSTFNVYSARPPYFATSSTPPAPQEGTQLKHAREIFVRHLACSAV